MEKMFTIKEFMGIFKISRKAYYEWVKKGIVKPLKICGTVRVTESEIDRLIKSSKEE